MKKILVLLFSVFVVMNVFAETDTAEVEVRGSSEATLNLTLANQYKLSFIKAADGGDEPDIVTGPVTSLSEFNLITTGNALTMSGEENLKLHDTQNVFYFYYQVYTNEENLIITISADNLKNEDSTAMISYKASFATVEGKWDGEALSRPSITSGSGTSASAKIKSSSTLKDYNYMGLCKVTISSVENEDLGKKKPGNYSAKIKLTLTAN